MFPTIHHINEIRPAVAHKQEIRFKVQPNGLTIGSYMFMDSKTFDTPLARECRGITFDGNGEVVSRPLHKFFNMGEKEHLTADRLSQRDDLVAIFEKLDGSMLATAWVAGSLLWRSKNSFTSDVVKLTYEFLAQPENVHIRLFAEEVAYSGMTAIFELMHPLARIVVNPGQPSLRLLHVRDNLTGEYVLLNPDHPIQEMVRRHGVPLVPRYPMMRVSEVLERLEGMTDQEGFVLQFADGDMVKLKCPWYQRLHTSVTFLRERDIALSSLNEELDDLKAVLAEAGIDLGPVNEVEARVKSRLLETISAVEDVASQDASLDRKAFALKHREHPLFGLMMTQYMGQEPKFNEWFIKNRLKQEFSLRVLADGALAEAMEG